MTRPLRVIYWAAPISLCLVLYSLGIRTWFSQDDFAWLGLRLQVHDFTSFLAAMFAPKAQGTIRPWSEGGFFMLFSYLFGLHALPYRVFIFCNQCLNIILLMLVTRKLTRSTTAGFFAPIVWLANIALITPMAWTSAYNEIQCATFLLLSFYLFLLYTDTGVRSYYWAQWLTFILGFGALEINFVYPALACVYALLLARPYIRSTLPMLATSAIYVAMDRVAIARSGTARSKFYYDTTFNVKSWMALLARYWRQLLGIAAYANQRHWPSWIGRFSAVLFGVVLIGFVIWQSRKRNLLPLFLIAWFPIVLGPFLPLHNHFSDYYLFLPSLGPAILAAYGIALSWQKGRKAIAASSVLLTLYLLPSLLVIQRGMQDSYNRAEGARVLIQSVSFAKTIHPDKVILLRAVDDNLFRAAVYDLPFRIFGWNDVFVTPESRANIHEAEYLSNIDPYFLAPRSTLSLLNGSAAVVYQVEGQQLRNVTQSYTRWAQSQPPPPLDPIIDLAVPFYSDQLGQGWYEQEAGYRWAGQHAAVYLPGPTSADQKLRIHGYVTADISKAGPLHLGLSIQGRPAPVQTIAGTKTDFDFNYDIPADLVGSKKLEIAFYVDRTTVLPGDGRALGVAFGTFMIR